MDIPFYEDIIPTLSTDQMIEVDRLMIEDYGITLLQMMENAGRNLANLARARFLDNNPHKKYITVLAGSGGNGGGALTAARRLANWGARVSVCLSKPADKLSDAATHQLSILKKMEIPIQSEELPDIDLPCNLILDGLIGYSLAGPPKGPTAMLIQWANEQDIPILSIDTPSGIDVSSGLVYNPTIKSAATMTLALPKRGLMEGQVRPYVGELYLADISVPPALYQKGVLYSKVEAIFAENDIVRIY